MNKIESSFFGLKNTWFKLGIFLILTVWLFLYIPLIYRAVYILPPYEDYYSRQEKLNGTYVEPDLNASFRGDIIAALIPYAIILLVLIPYSYRRFYFIRPLILLPPLGLWTFALIVTGMHAPPSQGIYALWLLGVDFFLFVLLILSFILEIKNSSKINRF